MNSIFSAGAVFVAALLDEVITQPTHKANWLNKNLEAESPYAVDDTDKLDMAYADLVERQKQEATDE